MGKEALAVPSSILFKERSFEGFLSVDDYDYTSAILKNYEYHPRGEELESNTSLQQIIPYVWIINPRKKMVFVYRRSSGKNYGEVRLKNKLSCGVGGHIERQDVSNPIMGAMMRELREEVKMESYPTPSIVGYVKLNHGVHGVHFGIVAVAKVNGGVEKGDDEMAECMMCSVEEVERLFADPQNDVEEWTRVSWPAVKKMLNSAQEVPIRLKMIHPDAKMPIYATEGSAGFDLYSIEDLTLEPNQTIAIRTGIAMEIHPDFYVKFEGRSGLGVRGIAKFAGVIDSDYRGEVKVVLCNTSQQPYKIEKGDRIAQGIMMRKYYAAFEIVDELSETQRGTGGFSSTGRK